MKKMRKTNFILMFFLTVFIVAANIIGSRAYVKKATTDADIPAYNGSPSVILNENEPEFKTDEITAVSFERYGELDDLGRCTTAMASIGRELMPTKDRESITMVKPTGWEQKKYPGLVDSDPPYLYNRCHMIGFQLTGENANEQNLITGTRYMNVEGMLPYENEVAEYVHSTGNHVMYRVTPVFEENNLLCDGVKIEALSVEDGGKGVSFNVFCYNVQPGVIIDYSDGSNKLDKDYKTTQSENADHSKAADQNNNKGQADEKVASDKTYSYIGNRNSHVFHYPDCNSVKDMKEKNKVYFEDVTRYEVIENGFRPCQNCKP
ncbi:DNA/RNA non-specific endonuclease [Butyrivibrio sp. LC3010]|uniref:DNA/RNA non-specific endonuclease n=1 Tax=Butyrivibrio sp. LC3010 TaxID=1280680 RepID=UPI0012DD6A6A|nr:DNA/RNA non-specific endonuclease [Butyrivibrio sp. LC3010]